ncbi:MerR family transcriptional regulator [Cohnella faecalis]|uniref:MerR family transcriptional regulator n=1 Tax=Cohnella faecalis TaxID=2315694 RepID=A0A398CGD5_9BACL|nr:MerR family transcriptional regulator [Cohnella faecalis]RIE01793.1 MerR family transcriptional regulator [Cohnella faecalis]
MGSDQLYSIGQAAKIGNISIQTLRFYDKIGLVVPSKIDKSSGYRYYSNADLLYLKVVQDMKAMNLSLKDIGHALKSDNLDGLLAKLEAKREETSDEIRRLERIGKSIEQRMSRIQFLQTLGNGLKDLDILVELKHFPDRPVLSDRRRTVCGMESSAAIFTEIIFKAEASGWGSARSMLTIFHDNIMTFDRGDTDLEFCILAEGAAEALPFSRTIPGGSYITALYCGLPNAESCKRIYGKLLDWIESSEYVESGPSIEQYLVDPTRLTNPEDFIVELQVPVEKGLTL